MARGGRDRLADLHRARGASEVGGADESLAEHLVDRPLHVLGGGLLADVAEQHRPRQDHGDGVRDALTGDVGRAAVDGLEHGVLPSDVGAGDQAEPADQPRAQVGHDVAVEVGQQQHVEALGSRASRR